jgi:cell division protein FtsQ
MKAGKRNRAGSKSASGIRKRMAAIVLNAKNIFFVAVPVIIAAVAVWFLSYSVLPVFRVRAIDITGNEHLSESELRQMAGLKGDESLIALSGKGVYERLKESPWIQAASVRKEYPSKLLVKVRETESFALLDMKGKMFIVDERGRMLEELKDNTVPFLPVILSDPYAEKDAFHEAVGLAGVVRKMGLLHKNQRIEIIAHKPNEISANLDGLLVKVGAGNYEEKLGRLVEIEEEVRKRGIVVDFIDLRYAGKVVVRPVNEVVR